MVGGILLNSRFVHFKFTVCYSVDFLEQEAPRMKDFLHTISSRSADGVGIQETSILDWSGYIDQGKQLSILHSLLTENMSKLPTNRNSEVLDLEQILARISNAKEMLAYPVVGGAGESDMDSSLGKHQMQQHNQENQLPQQQVYVSGGHKQNDRGVIRGVLTPSSLEKNIFRYNDPTCAPLIQSLNAKNSQLGGTAATNLDGMAALHHSHSTSSISSAPNYYYNDARNHMNSTPAKMSAKHMQSQYPIANSIDAIHKVPVSKVMNSGGAAYGQNPEIKHISHHVYDGLLNSNNNHEGPAYRSHNTLPKNPQQHHNNGMVSEGVNIPCSSSCPLTASLPSPPDRQIQRGTRRESDPNRIGPCKRVRPQESHAAAEDDDPLLSDLSPEESSAKRLAAESAQRSQHEQQIQPEHRNPAQRPQPELPRQLPAAEQQQQRRQCVPDADESGGPG